MRLRTHNILFKTCMINGDSMKQDLGLSDTAEYSGRLLKFFLVAYAEFNKDQINLEDFKVLISENEKQVRISFSPNLAPGERILGGSTSLGRGVSYDISKENMEVLRRPFHK